MESIQGTDRQRIVGSDGSAQQRTAPLQSGEYSLPEPPSEFQRFVYQATGQWLKIYGSDLFQGVPSTFAPADSIPVTSDYLIGPGDEIAIRAWGQIDVNYRAVVDRSGDIFIPKVGTISVAGVRFGQLQEYLRSQISRVFKNFDLSVTMGQLRSIQVLIVGQARRPGSYTLSSLSTVVSALFASGGPSSKGSMRRIQLKRGDRLVTEFDLYDLLLRGDKSKDAPLLNGDVIYIPTIGPEVAVLGSIRGPAVYELRDSSTLQDLLHFAGGLGPTAVTKKLTIERVTSRELRSIQDVELNEAGLATELRDGDLVMVRSLTAEFENSVVLRGNVAYPGRYPWRPGIRVHDLIPNKQSLVIGAFWQRQNELGLEKDKTQKAWEYEQLFVDAELRQRPGESAAEHNRRLEAYKLDRSFQIQKDADNDNKDKGEQVTAPGRSALGEEELHGEISRNAPDVNWDYAVIQRIDRENLTTRLLPFNLGMAISGNETQNLALQPGDVITIFSQADIRVPEAKKTKYVRLEGEFLTAGVYEVQPGETLRSLVERVGGMTKQAYLFGSEFFRESSRVEQQKRYDAFLAGLELDVERSASTKSQNVVAPEEAVGLKAQVESQRKLVDKLRTLHPTGRVVLGLKPTDVTLSDLPELVLEDGDRFIVPYVPGTVNVLGSVYAQNSYLFEKSRTPNFYLKKAGGGTRDADTGHTFVVRADGTVISKSQSSSWFTTSLSDLHMMPGDTVVIPEQISKTSLLKGLKDWSQVFAQFALGAAAFKSLTQ